MKRFCFDLDGTICHHKLEGETYADVLPMARAVEFIKELKSLGHYVIILTARNMATHNNNVGKIIAQQGPIVIEWLKKWDIPYDELHFGKPNADYFIDDKGITFTDFETLKKLLYK